MLNDWSHKVRAILKKYCPPHKARGIHDFILATKSSVWIIICNNFFFSRPICCFFLIHSICVSVISIKGTECKMSELGQVADATGGQVRIWA